MTQNDSGIDRQKQPLQALLKEALDEAGDEKLKVGDILGAYGARSFGPVIAVLALIVISPVGAIPFLPMIFAALIALLSIQLLMGREDPWVPAKIKHVGVERAKAEKFRSKAAKWLAKIDAVVSTRLTWAAGRPARYLAALCCLLLSLVMAAPPLELIPYAVALPASAILLFGLALTARDGLLMLIGYAITAAALYFAYSWIFGGSDEEPARTSASALLAPMWALAPL